MKQNLQKLFLNTFDEKNKNSFKDFKKVEPLIKNSTRKEIQSLTGVSYNNLSNWVRLNPRIPFSVRCFEKASKRSYFKLDNGRLEILAYLIGYVFGDGSISKDKCKVWFYGISSDLPKINEMLEEFGVQGTIRVYKINNGKLAVCDNAFTRLIVSLGAPIGDKVRQNLQVPEWIASSDKKIKKRFLQGLFDSELSRLQNYKGKSSFQSLKFYMAKEIGYVNNGVEYLNQIRKLVSEFGVSTTCVRKYRIYLRRNGENAQQLYFIIHSNSINLNSFIKEIGFLTNAKRVESLLINSRKIENNAKIELRKIKNYKLCMKMRRDGMSAYKISEELKIPTHLVKSWTYKNRKPRLFQFCSGLI